MRVGLVLASFALLTFGGQTASAVEWIDRIPLQNIVPPPPPHGSQIEKDEIAEILKARATATPAAMAQAVHDDAVEDPGIFAAVLGPGWNLNNLPKTQYLLARVMDVDRADSSDVKHFFHRPRPFIVDPKVQTCTPYGGGQAVQRDSYPSGHAMLAYELGVVMASLMPNHAQAILTRAWQYSENRIVCGYHYRSDVTAGMQFGTVLAVEMLKHPVFQGWFRQAQAELKAAGLAR